MSLPYYHELFGPGFHHGSILAYVQLVFHLHFFRHAAVRKIKLIQGGLYIPFIKDSGGGGNRILMSHQLIASMQIIF